jgi:hypothetical protein
VTVNPRGSDDAIQRFVERAESYCGFIEQAGTLDLRDRLRRAQQELLGLYSEALDLPAAEPDERVAEPSSVLAPDWPGMGELDFYWEVFDPYELADDEPVGATLSGDLLDVYCDVRGGLEMLRAHGERGLPAATWHWRFTFETHWGDHAIDALRALHRAVKR